MMNIHIKRTYVEGIVGHDIIVECKDPIEKDCIIGSSFHIGKNEDFLDSKVLFLINEAVNAVLKMYELRLLDVKKQN